MQKKELRRVSSRIAFMFKPGPRFLGPRRVVSSSSWRNIIKIISKWGSYWTRKFFVLQRKFIKLAYSTCFFLSYIRCLWFHFFKSFPSPSIPQVTNFELFSTYFSPCLSILSSHSSFPSFLYTPHYLVRNKYFELKIIWKLIISYFLHLNMLILLSISWGMGAHHIWQLKDILHKSGRAIWIKAMAVGCFVNCGTMEGEREKNTSTILRLVQEYIHFV